MVFGSGFSWWTLIPGVEDGALDALGMGEHTIALLSASLAAVAVILFSVAVRIGLNSAQSRPGLEKYYAGTSLSPLTVAELMGEFILGFMRGALPEKEVKVWFGYCATIFLYILFCNLQGLFPGFLPPTDNINSNLGMAIGCFLVFNFVGLSKDPVGYISHLMGPVLLLAPLMFPLEAFGLIVRPISLSLRLAGNLFGDHLVFDIMNNRLLVPFVPAGLLGLAIFVSGMQAFIFSLLASVYISLSLPHHDHDDHH